MEIQIRMIDLSEQEIIDGSMATLDITDNYLRFRFDFSAREYSQDTAMWEDAHHDVDIVALKNKVSSVDKSTFMFKESEIYKITISVEGRMEDVKLYFDNQKEADDIFGLILKWLF